MSSQEMVNVLCGKDYIAIQIVAGGTYRLAGIRDNKIFPLAFVRDAPMAGVPICEIEKIDMRYRESNTQLE